MQKDTYLSLGLIFLILLLTGCANSGDESSIAASIPAKSNNGCGFVKKDFSAWKSADGKSWYDTVPSYKSIQYSHWTGECVNGTANGNGELIIHMNPYTDLFGNTTFSRFRFQGFMKNSRFNGPVKLISNMDPSIWSGITFYHEGKPFFTKDAYIKYITSIGINENIPQNPVNAPILKSESIYLNCAKKLLDDNRNGTLTDRETGLTWRRCAVGQKWWHDVNECSGDKIEVTWPDAIKLAGIDRYGGYSDWRLPSRDEYSKLLTCKSTDINVLDRDIFQVFRGYRSQVAWGDSHWTSTTSNDFKTPIHADLELGSGMIRGLFDSALRPFAKKPIMLVRGGNESNDWLKAKNNLDFAYKAANISRIEGAEYWSDIDKKLKSLLTTIDNALKTSAGNTSNSYCSSSDTCFTTVSTRKDEVTIKCIKGPQDRIGRTFMICGPNNKGKWAAGCGITESFAYHHTFKEAGNRQCNP